MLRGHYCNARLIGEGAAWAITAAHGIWRDDAHRAAASVGKHQPAGEVIDDDARRDRHVHRVLSAKLRYLKAPVAQVDHLLVHTFHLIAKHNGIAAARLGREVVQLRAADHLLDGIHLVARSAQIADGL